MPLSNAQYDEIMREYDRRQLQNRRRLDARRREVYAKQPLLQQLDAEVASGSVQRARLLLDGDAAALPQLRAELAEKSAQRERLLSDAGYPADYLDPVYTCPDCRDTGYHDGQKCHCFKQAIINTVYAQSNIRAILERENFDAFSYDYYAADEINGTTGLSALATAQNAVRACHLFIDQFESKPQNLFFYGKTGVGKTFLSNCVARELLDQGYSVIYFTAFQLFDILSKGVFEKDTDAIAAHQNIFDCDLLVIDDLGTELSNAFTTSQLFLCVNERLLRGKSTIISTNLSLNQIVEVYSERTFSRICDAYTLIHLFSKVDIRIQKRKNVNKFNK
jgi:DNA replication protein DnaC